MQYQTPGVYTIEKNAFPNSVVEVATAIPAFVGYTRRATTGGKDLTKVPTRVESLKEFEDYFGRGFNQVFTLTALKTPPTPNDDQPNDTTLAVLPMAVTFPDAARTSFELAPEGDESPFYLYNAVRLFYLNGGSTCYIVSVGDYDATATADDFLNAIESLVYEQDPTMLLCPDALRLNQADYYKVVQQMLAHCENLQSRVAILDVYRGAMTKSSGLATTPNPISVFRDNVGQNALKYGTAYFPWVNSSVTAESDITFLNLDAASLGLLRDSLNPAQAAGASVTVVEAKVPKLGAATADDTENIFDQAITLLDNATVVPGNPLLTAAEALDAKRTAINNSLLALYPSYSLVIKSVARYVNTLPVASAMAGVYTSVDNSRGVWKAPANVSLNAVVSPTLSLSDKNQDGLNIDAVSGKSINAIRSFKGLGVLVWGARTLDGNSQDWKYINVRRTMIMIEQSIKLAARAYVFEPNDANTWSTVKSMIDSFLFNLWKQGALAGSAPADAYNVSVGLGSTMTADDVLNGYLNVTVLVALVRPAEFIVLTFQQQMQKS